MKLVNLTPHKISVFLPNGEKTEIEPSGTVARVQARSVEIGTVEGIPVVRTEFGAVDGLPEPQPNTIFIVSTLVAQALKGKRHDIVAPDTSPQSAIRDENGRIMGIKRFQTF